MGMAPNIMGTKNAILMFQDAYSQWTKASTQEEARVALMECDRWSEELLRWASDLRREWKEKMF